MTGKSSIRERRTRRLGLLGGIVLVVLTGQLLLLHMGDGLARWSYDLPFLMTRQSVPQDLVMVYLDSKIKAKLGQSTDQPLDRRFYAQLLERLTREGARLVAFDILFDRPQTDSNTDAEFAEAIRKQGRVVLVGEYVEQVQEHFLFDAPVPPIAILTNSAAGWGLANVVTGPDQEVRFLSTGAEDFPSVDWVAASLLGAETTRAPRSRSAERWLNYYCEPTALHAVNLDYALEPDGLSPGYFRDKIVIVGSQREAGVAGAEGDEFLTPYSFTFRKYSLEHPSKKEEPKREPMAPGAAIHAFTLLNLVHGDWMTRLGYPQEAGLVITWGILISVILLRLRPWVATLCAPVMFCAFACVASYVERRYHLWFSWLVPAGAQTSVALIWSVGFQYGIESRRRRMLRRAFGAYLSP